MVKLSNIKNILNKIYISPFLYLFAFFCILFGLFKMFLIVYLIIIMHELGHITMALLFKYEIIKINIYPFGGYTIFNYDLNTNFISEFMLFIGGILFQLLLYFIFNIYVDNTSYIYKLFINYNITLILFNILPIIPLDGSKVLNILLNTIFPFDLSNKITIFISYITSILLFIVYYKNINVVIMVILFIVFTYKESKNNKYIFNRFLIERYIKNLRFKNNNFIFGNNAKSIKKYKNNVFIINNKYVIEKELIKERYKL